MKFFLFFILIVILIFPFLKDRRDRSKYYQLPIIFSITTFVLIIPSLFTELFADKSLEEIEYNLYVFNIILCLLGSYIGYFKKDVKLNTKIQKKYNINKMLFLIVPFFLVGFYISFFIVKAEEFGSVFGGLFAILIFFGRLIRPSAIIIFFIHLLKPRLITFLLLLIWILVPIRFIIISGRRSEFFLFAITILIPLFFVKNYIPNKKLMLSGAIIGFMAYFILPLTRVYTKQGDFDSIKDINVMEAISAYNKGEKTNEVYEAAINMNLVYQNGEYSYGALYINKFINQFVSSTFFGAGLKESLTIDTFDFETARREVVIKGKYKNYLAPSGYVDSFYDFGFFAFIPFFIFARLAKRFWFTAHNSSDLYSKMFYVYFVVFMFMAIYDSLSFLPILFLQAALVFIPIKYLSKS